MDNMDEQYEDAEQMEERKWIPIIGAAVTCQRWYGFFSMNLDENMKCSELWTAWCCNIEYIKILMVVVLQIFEKGFENSFIHE